MGKKVVLSLFADRILYTENPKDTIRKLWELITDFTKVAGYKINTQKSFAFLYTNNEISEIIIKESIPFAIATKRIKHLGINLPKETKELYTETYKTLIKKNNNKGKVNRWRNSPCSWVRRISIVKMIIPPNVIYRFNAISIKLPMEFFIELWQKTSFTIHMKIQKTLNKQNSLEKEKWSWKNQLWWLQTILQSCSDQYSVVLTQKEKYRAMEQNRKPRDKPMHLWIFYIWQRRQEYIMGQRWYLQ